MRFRTTASACLTALLTPLLASVVVAQVQVIEAGTVVPAQQRASESGSLQGKPAAPPATVSPATPSPATTGSVQGELFYQLQLLQDEVMQLRGVVEEQQHLIRQLQQQRLDDYLNLDKRISELSIRQPPGVAGNTSSVTATQAQSASKTGATATQVAASADESVAYKTAYGLVKAQKFPEAKSAFETFTQRFPNGNYRPNALYWLGELYLLESDQESARQAFTQLIDRYPDHRKNPDAMFKLAKVYHLQGNGEKSKALLKRVVEQYSGQGHSAARLAQDYLDKNFKR